MKGRGKMVAAEYFVGIAEECVHSFIYFREKKVRVAVLRLPRSLKGWRKEGRKEREGKRPFLSVAKLAEL